LLNAALLNAALLNAAMVSLLTDALVASGAARRDDGHVTRRGWRETDAGQASPSKTMKPVNGLTFFSLRSCLPVPGVGSAGATEMTTFHGVFELGSSEAGSVAWHARIGCANNKPLEAGVACSQLQAGVAWPDSAAAIPALKTRGDRSAACPAARDDTSVLVQPATIA
jgi:hypothetical protein